MALGARGSLVGALLAFGALTGAGCSQSRLPDEDVGRFDAPIIGGKLDTTHRGVVSLLRELEEEPGVFVPACSGTLLTANLVLTAHHCVASLTSRDGTSVECGVTEFGATASASSFIVSVEANVGKEGRDPFPVDKIWVPPGVGSAVCGNDIALMLLSDPGIPGSDAVPIEPRLSTELGASERFAAIGYGLQDPNDQEGRTIGHRMSVANQEVSCVGAECLSQQVMDGEWDATSPICSGDSGGPALDQNGRVAGIISRGDAECSRAIYTSVYAWRDFIRDKVVEAAGIGNYAPPAWAIEAPTTPAPASPLGQSCTGSCPDSYLCWSSTAQPPGICVPPCGDSASACPAHYSCSSDLGACIPDSSDASNEGKDSGCSVGSAPRTGASWMALAVLGVGLGLGAARRRSRS